MIKKIETWRWRNRDPQNGRTRRAAEQMTEQEASQTFPGAERIEGSRLLQVQDDFADTMPRLFWPGEPE